MIPPFVNPLVTCKFWICRFQRDQCWPEGTAGRRDEPQPDRDIRDLLAPHAARMTGLEP
jgi:hypothetical protein